MKYLYFYLKKDFEDEVVVINGIKWGNLWFVLLVNNSEIFFLFLGLVFGFCVYYC